SQKPPKALLELEDATQLVDGMSGPTRKQYKEMVVSEAALSTWRIARLVRATQQILVGAPINSDSKRLETMIRGVQEPIARARAVAAFLPTAESETLAQQAYRVMSRDYFAAVRGGAKPDQAVEAELLAPHLPSDMSVIERIYACYTFANAGVRLDLASACIQGIKKSAPVGGADVELALLEGTILHRQGNHANAIQALSKAASAVDLSLDPMPHLRLTLSLIATGETTIACTKGRSLYVMHPALEGVKDALRACISSGGSIEPIVAELDQERRALLLASRLDQTSPLATMNLSNEAMAPAPINLASAGKVTVLAFFATWCPHCQTELPKLTALADELSRDTQRSSRVQIVGVRTAVEREKEPYPQFKTRFGLNFPIHVDPTLSLVFGKFCRDHERQPGLPTLAIVDQEGKVRYFIDSGEFRHLREDILWAVDSLL
ncbi:MAG: TlpA disulfide reductase family protein, partial [Myxococcota bacterium]|nr:TlpA disulfide reductase family protein [Myxococcota bacterium]